MSLETSKELHFHDFHGNNIVLKNNKTLACREKSFNNGIVFSHRPIMIRERIVFQIKKTTNYGRLRVGNYGTLGGLYIGFTCNDPSNIRGYMINNTRVLFKSYSEVFILLPHSTNKDDYVLSFYYDNDGFVHYAVNNGEETCFEETRVDVSLKLWAIIDLFGIVSEIELLGSSYSLLILKNR